MGLTVELSNGDSDLDGILALQQANMRGVVAPDEALRSGFVTVGHTREILERMHDLGPSVVARRGSELVGYALTMTVECRALVPLLEPMFQRFDALTYNGRALLESPFYVMGQICVAASARGQGVFDRLYAGHREHYARCYQLLVTEISARNARSLRAHERVGFSELTRYRDETDDWVIVVLDLRT
jgi:predicted GNAT superfamily acetyltransferase